MAAPSGHDHALTQSRSPHLRIAAGLTRHIWVTDGFRGLYRGLGPTIIGYLPTWAIYFTVYDQVKRQLEDIRGELVRPSTSSQAFPAVFARQSQSQRRRGEMNNQTMYP